MVMAKGGDLVEVVARGDGGAGQQQQDLGQQVDDPARLTVVFEPGKILQSSATRALGTSSSAKKSAVLPIRRPAGAQESHLRVKPKSSLT